MTQHDNVHHLHADLFSRDGHLTMLTLDRFEAGELSTAMCETVIEHLESCEMCASRLASMQGDAVDLEPPAFVRAAASSRRASRSWLGAASIGVTVAAAAVLLVLAMPAPQHAERTPSTEERLTASPYTTTAEPEGAIAFEPAFDVSVVDEDGHRVQHGARVSWDTTLTLNVSPHDAGYVAVVSATAIEDEPADTDGGAVEHDVHVLMPVSHLEARSGPHALAIEHPDPRGLGTAQERLLAIFCEDSFALDDPFDPALPGLRDDCTSVEVSLARFGDFADS